MSDFLNTSSPLNRVRVNALPDEYNLSVLRKTGVFYVSNPVDGPVGVPGDFFVTVLEGERPYGIMAVQQLIKLSNGVIYTRIKQIEGWGAWNTLVGAEDGGTLTGEDIVELIDTFLGSEEWRAWPTGSEIADRIDDALGSPDWRGGGDELTGDAVIELIDTQLGSDDWRTASDDPLNGADITTLLDDHLGSTDWRAPAVTGEQVSGLLDDFLGSEDWRDESLSGETIADMLDTFLESPDWRTGASGGEESESHTHPNASITTAGFMSAADKSKLNGIQTGAQVNPTAAAIVTAINSQLGGDGWQTTDGLSSAQVVAKVTLELGTDSWKIGGTNLSYGLDVDRGYILSDTGDTAEIPLANGIYAGLLAPSDFTKLGTVELGAEVNLDGTEIVAAIDTELGSTGWREAGGVGTPGEANLAYVPSPTNGTVTSDAGADAVISLANGTNAGLMSPEDFLKLDGVGENAEPNLIGDDLLDAIDAALEGDDWRTVAGATNLDFVGGTNTGTITSDTGTDALIPAASPSAAGLLTAALYNKLDGVEEGAEVNPTGEEIMLALDDYFGTDDWRAVGGGVDLGYTASPTGGTITNDAGDDATLTLVTDTNAGLMTPYEHNKLAGIQEGANNLNGEQIAALIDGFLEGDEWRQITGATNLSYSSSDTNGVIVSDTGDDATIPLVSDTIAGLMSPGQRDKLNGIEVGAEVNYTGATLLSSIDAAVGHDDWRAASATNITVAPFDEGVWIESSTGDAGFFGAATGAVCGAMTPAQFTKLGGIEEGAEVNLSIDDIVEGIDTLLGSEDWRGVGAGANLAYTAAPTNGIITNDAGDDATIPVANGTNAGLMPPAMYTKLDGIETGAEANPTGTEIADALDIVLGSDTWRDASQALPALAVPSYGLLVNPWFDFDQENLDSAIGLSTTKYPCDQWVGYENAATLVLLGQRVANPSISTADFRRLQNAMRVTVSTAQASLSSGEYARPFIQPIEGSVFKHLGWGSGDARDLILVGCAQASLTGDYAVTVRNSAENRSYVTTISLVANTPTYFVKVIPGDTSGTWLTAEGVIGAIIEFGGVSGSTGRISSLDTWTDGTYYSHASVVGWQGTTSATVHLMHCNAFPEGTLPFDNAGDLFGDKLHRYLSARRHNSEDFALCQRYWQILGGPQLSGAWIGGSAAFIQGTFPVTMAKDPVPAMITLTPVIDEPGIASRTGVTAFLTNTTCTPNSMSGVAQGFSGATAWRHAAVVTPRMITVSSRLLWP